MNYLSKFLKYFVQIAAMFSDLLIIGMAGGLIYTCIQVGSPFLWLISIILLTGTYKTWKEQGGFIAWTKKGRTAFLTNWDKIQNGELVGK